MPLYAVQLSLGQEVRPTVSRHGRATEEGSWPDALTGTPVWAADPSVAAVPPNSGDGLSTLASDWASTGHASRPVAYGDHDNPLGFELGK